MTPADREPSRIGDLLIEMINNAMLRKTGAATLLACEVLKAFNATRVPEGWQLVPKEPTPEMLHALSRVGRIDYIWRAALAAAPKHEGAQG